MNVIQPAKTCSNASEKVFGRPSSDRINSREENNNNNDRLTAFDPGQPG